VMPALMEGCRLKDIFESCGGWMFFRGDLLYCLREEV
jgi:hypothetical protein